jgi:tetratricopeptide (TPR) repeat protein
MAYASYVPASAEGAPFVGRERELSELRAGLDEALAGNGAFYLIAGEPGIGKTRLAGEFARQAAAIGTRVWRGCSVEDNGAPPYWPWIQVLRHCQDACLPALAQMGTALLSSISPTPQPDMPRDPVAFDSEAARFRLFDAVALLLRNLSAVDPVVVFIDDLQWADESSLLLLQYLARALAGTRVLLLGAYRDVEARFSPEAGRRIAALACDARTMHLGGLSGSEVAVLIERTASAALSHGVAREVHRGTGGNPLFVDEVLRTLAAEGRLERPLAVGALPLPERVRALIRRRVRLVSEGCGRVLSAAATLGRDGDLGALDQVCAARGDRPLDVADEARAAGILIVSEGRFAFEHDVFREVLYDDLGERERGALHAEVGGALERIHAAELDLHLPELAHHFVRAGLAESKKAVHYSIRAAERAARGLAFAEAAAHYKRGLERLAVSGVEDAARRCRILLALGENLWSSGEFDEAKQTYENAADIAETAHLNEELARAALGAAGPYVGFGAGVVDRRLAALLEKGLAAIGEAEGTLGASLMARLATVLTYSAERERGAALARRAVEIARRLGDKPTLHFVLSCLVFATWSPDNLEERLAIGREITRLGAEGEGAGAAGFYGLLASVSHVESGDVAAADREAEAYRQRTQASGQRIHAWFLAVHRTTKALLEGRFAEVESLALEALRLGQEAQNQGAAQLFGVQMLALRREQGRLAELVGGIEALVADLPAVPAWRAARAMILAEIGRDAEARRELDRLAVAGFADLPRDMLWLVCMWLLTETVARLGDARRAAVLHALLLPFADRLVHTGAAFCGGSVERSLGLLAQTASRHDEAAAHFERAIAENARIGATAWAAHARHDYARTLLACARADDRGRAVELLRRAEESARGLGMTQLLARVERLLADAAPAPSSGREAVLRREGEYWTVAYEGFSARVRDARGLRLIALLLASPGREFSTVELAAWPAPPPEPGRTHDVAKEAGLQIEGNDGDVLDDQARAEYRAHLADLRAEAEEAERFNDVARAAKAREEIALFTEQLVAVARSGSRRRSAASERARLSVTKAIRYAIGKVERVHPALARLLAGSVKTGSSCRYEPDPERPVRWLL